MLNVVGVLADSRHQLPTGGQLLHRFVVVALVVSSNRVLLGAS
ncbi:hypothetical protein [Rhodococcus sp. USK13]|nr:hypothetical protein [Rhodococcus sp. USK13]